MNRFCAVFLFASLLLTGACAGRADATPALVDRSLAASAIAQAAGPPRPAVATAGIGEREACTFIDFEGLGDQQSIPPFDGIQSPDWLAVIDSDAGGIGNTAHEPSPETVALWLGGPTGTGSSRDILFDTPASRVTFRYASAVLIIVAAYDIDNNLIKAEAGPANFGTGPGGDPNGTYNKWDPITVQSSSNNIVRVKVSGAVNQTGIDNLEVCRLTRIEAAEFTQAIQELQTIEELQADLLADGEPPVPVIRRKPAALRLYFDDVQTVTKVIVEADIAGTSQSRIVTLMPKCPVILARVRLLGCQSADFYFIPPTGSWTADVRVKSMAGTLLEEHSFELHSRRTEPLVLAAVRLCDAKDAAGKWLCEDDYAARLAGLSPLLRNLAPTGEVRTMDSRQTIRRLMDANSDGMIPAGESNAWWVGTRFDISDLFGLFDGYRDISGYEDRRYYGLARPTLPGGILGIAADIPSRGALSVSSAQDLGVDVSADTVAHETGHMLGREHTNTAVPAASEAPGCHLAGSASTDWPFADNRLRAGDGSASTLEVGFDVAARRPVFPTDTYDVMSYCAPVWISPFTYTHILEEELDSPLEVQPASTRGALAPGDFWQVSGTIDAGTVEFRPLFEIETIASTDAGSGLYAIEVVDGVGGRLFIRYFDPAIPQARVQAGAGEPEFSPAFSELIPVQQSAATLRVLDTNGLPIGSIDLAGAVPVVEVTSPTGSGPLAGEQTISWMIDDPDSADHDVWVQYSANPEDVDAWQTLGKGLSGNQLTADFDLLAGGTDTAVVRVLASDGVHTGTATAGPFQVPSKQPEAVIVFPPDASVFQKDEVVWLQGIGLDADDGSLAAEALVWESNADGVIGMGEDLPTTSLSVGDHEITLSATDADANVATATVHVVIAGAGPAVHADVEPLDLLPTTCVQVTLDAEAGSVPVEGVDYSLDGGETYTTVPVASLPYEFIAAGSGFFHLVARAFDASGQVDAVDRRFFTDAPCGPTSTSTTTTTLAPGNCGDANGSQTITAADALSALQAAVGSRSCELCLCDANGSGTIEASDALRVLRKAVGLDVAMNCEPC